MAGGTMKRKWNLPNQSGFASMIEDGNANPLRAGQGAAHCAGWEDDMARVDRPEFAH
jgi:hypothetical protein